MAANADRTCQGLLAARVMANVQEGNSKGKGRQETAACQHEKGLVMHTPMSPAEMRQLVLDGFQRRVAHAISAADVEERVRTEEGKVVAYCYRTANLFAMWMVQIHLVQFYDDQGNMLHTLDLAAAVGSERRAA